METSELLRRAWEAVEDSGLPEPLHGVALQEAIADLRAREGGIAANGKQEVETPGSGSSRRKSKSKSSAKSAEKDTTTFVDEDTFYANLTQESGVAEADIRDVLSFSDGAVLITQPTRKLGSSRASQAQTAIALVAGARAYGLGERPVSATALRRELDRKGCYDGDNFANKHLGPLRGFNAGANRTQIVTTSHWLKEFKAAIDQTLERKTDAV